MTTRGKLATYLVLGVLVGLLVGGGGYYYFASTAPTASQQDLTKMFNGFITAQNAHNISAVSNLLLNSPNFLWITKGTPIVGHDAAITRFQTIYGGTWKLAPDMSKLQIIKLSSNGDTWRIYDPILFTIGAAGAQPTQTLFLMSMIVVDTPDGLRVASILPIAAAT